MIGILEHPHLWCTAMAKMSSYRYSICIRYGYGWDTDTTIPKSIRRSEKKSLFLFRYSLDMPGIHLRYGEYQSDTREVKKKKKNSPNLVSPCLCLSLSVFSFLHFASCLFWLKVLGFYIYIFGYLLLWVCDINYNHIVIDKIINVILFVV